MQNPFPVEVYKARKDPKEYPIRGEFFRDQTAIIHSMPFRRLKHKTQVFFAPGNDHVCTRIEHVLHVATIGSTICKGLINHGWQLNQEMAYAIGIGHDLGHSPFGHSGEAALNRKLGNVFTFMHEVHGLRVVDKLCNNGHGLNLTFGVRDGIINHNGEVLQQSIKPAPAVNDIEKIRDRKSVPSSYEGCIVRFADKIAYLGRDIEDAYMAGFISPGNIPEKISKELGTVNGEIINNLVKDVIETSGMKDQISMSDEMFETVKLLQQFNYDNIYRHPAIEAYRIKGEKIIEELFDYLLELLNNYGINYPQYSASAIHLDQHFGDYLRSYHAVYEKEYDIPKRIVCDFIAGMTDNYALDAYQQIKLPKPLQFR